MEPTTKKLEPDMIAGLQHGSREMRESIIRRLIDEWGGIALTIVRNANGNDADADDVFNESLAALIRNVMEGKFKGESKLSTYFYSICRLRYLKMKKPGAHLEINEETFGGLEPSLEHVLIDEERRREKVSIMNRVVNSLGEPCASILKYWSLGYSHEKTGELIGRSTDTVKNQAGRCRKRMRESIESDPVLYHKLKALR